MIKVREKTSDKNAIYPNIELVPLIGHVGPEIYYEIQEGDRPEVDHRTHKVMSVTEYSIEIGIFLPLYKIVYQSEQLSNELIESNVNNEAENYIEENYPIRERNANLSALVMINDGEPDPDDEKAYFKNVEKWMRKVRKDAQGEIDKLYQNGTLPSFDYDIKPIKT